MTDHDVVGIAESWGNGNVGDAEIAVDCFNIFTLDQSGFGVEDWHCISGMTLKQR